MPEREDAPVALGEQPLAALGHAVVDVAPGAHAAQQAAAYEPGQRDARRALGEPELAEQLDESARPHVAARLADVDSEQRDDEVLRLHSVAAHASAEDHYCAAGARSTSDSKRR